MTETVTRVVMVSPLPPPIGGIARWTQKLQRDLSADDRVALRVVNAAVRSRVAHDLSPAHRLRAGVMTTLRVSASLARHLVAGRPDVVHVNTSGSVGLLTDLVLITICWVARVPVVIHLRFGRTPDIIDDRGWESWLLRLVSRRADCVIAIDQRTSDALENLGHRRVVLVPNYHHDPGKPSGPSPRQSVLFVGRVSEAKGVEDLITAWSPVIEGWELLLVGPSDPQYAHGLMAQAPEDSGIRFVGEKSPEEVLSMMRGAGAVILPSHTEGFPNVVVEAMSYGKPVIATDVGAIPEMLENGAGVVVPARNPVALRRALERTLSDPAGREEMGRRAAMAFRSKYERSIVLDRYVQLWSSLGRRRSSAAEVAGGRLETRTRSRGAT